MRTSGPSAARAPSLRRVVHGAAALAALVLAVFGRTVRNGFISYDDNAYVTANPDVLRGLTPEGFRWALGIHLGNWHPVTWLSHMLDVELFGLHPAGHHLVSVLIHAAATGLCFALLCALTGAFWRSLVAAALFGIHPLRVESVAWVAERKDVLAGLLWFLALLCWLRYARRPSRGRLASCLGVFAAGLAAKPTAMALPAVLLLLDWWPLGRFAASRSAAAGARHRRAATLLLEKVPFVALSAASLAVTFRAQTEDALRFVNPGFTDRLANAAVSAAVYLGKSAWPARLGVLYPFPAGGVPPWRAAAAGILLAGTTAAVLAAARRRPYLAFGWLWYLVTLLPVAGLVQMGAQARADRYTYLPHIGVAVALAWLVGDAAAGNRSRRAALAAATAAAVLLLSAATVRQAGFWRDGVTLYRHTLAVTGDNPIILYNLANDYRASGQPERAYAAFQEVLRTDPGSADAANNAGDILFKAGRPGEAATMFEYALRLEPSNPVFHFNLGMARARQGRRVEALEEWRLLRSTDPERAQRLWAELGPPATPPSGSGASSPGAPGDGR